MSYVCVYTIYTSDCHFQFGESILIIENLVQVPKVIFSSLQAVRLGKFDYRLSNKLTTDLQKLRCRVNYHALKFTDEINKMGQILVERMRMKSKNFIALHLR